LTFSQLESLLSPVLILSPGRDAVVVPIRKEFADRLFQCSRQLLLFGAPEAVLLTERAYFSAPRTAGTLQQYVPLFFYESAQAGRGRGSIIASARITATQIVEKQAMTEGLSRRGVLNHQGIASITDATSVAATLFDNIMLLRKPIALQALRTIGCADPSNFVTARKIQSQHAIRIAEDGEPHATEE
jgi:hypothetical protein